MSKVYDYEQSKIVISEAWQLAIKHLEDTLGDQYKFCCTGNVAYDFHDYVEQDINFLKVCPTCGEVDEEGNFYCNDNGDEICYECHHESQEGE